VRLELRLSADVGIVGLPNAGKSTLLARLTGARPKIADYPFTTLRPNLGVADLGSGRSLTVADVPGLIEGAHQGAGLGLAFLRHLERTRALIHLVDASLGEAAIVAAYHQVTSEMEQHDPELAAKPALLVANKLDLLEEGEGASLLARLSEWIGSAIPVLGISAATGFGCERLLEVVGQLARRSGEWGQADPGEGGFRLYRGPRGLSREFVVRRDEGGLSVTGESLERLVAVTDLDDDSAVLRLQRQLVRIGVERALLEAGAGPGDEVRIGEEVFTFYPDPAAGAPGLGSGRQD
jgi:GTP-binding protein